MLSGQALVYGMHRALHVDGESYLMWNMAMFSGGPQYWMAQDLLQAVAGRGYRQDIAQRELARLVGITKNEDGELGFTYGGLFPGSVPYVDESSRFC